MNLFLFKKLFVVDIKQESGMIFSGERWVTTSFDTPNWAEVLEQRKQEGSFVQEKLDFVGEFKDEKEVAQIVRKSPLSVYTLFRGEAQNISAAISVFVDGKNLETLTQEWGNLDN